MPRRFTLNPSRDGLFILSFVDLRCMSEEREHEDEVVDIYEEEELDVGSELIAEALFTSADAVALLDWDDVKNASLVSYGWNMGVNNAISTERSVAQLYSNAHADSEEVPPIAKSLHCSTPRFICSRKSFIPSFSSLLFDCCHFLFRFLFESLNLRHSHLQASGRLARFRKKKDNLAHEQCLLLVLEAQMLLVQIESPSLFSYSQREMAEYKKANGNQDYQSIRDQIAKVILAHYHHLSSFSSLPMIRRSKIFLIASPSCVRR